VIEAEQGDARSDCAMPRRMLRKTAGEIRMSLGVAIVHATMPTPAPPRIGANTTKRLALAVHRMVPAHTSDTAATRPRGPRSPGARSAGARAVIEWVDMARMLTHRGSTHNPQ
jgi:hypothetical protein